MNRALAGPTRISPVFTDIYFVKIFAPQIA